MEGNFTFLGSSGPDDSLMNPNMDLNRASARLLVFAAHRLSPEAQARRQGLINLSSKVEGLLELDLANSLTKMPEP
ncbi:hypothetical protein LguiA_011001 [Lonicera macranthoides]